MQFLFRLWRSLRRETTDDRFLTWIDRLENLISKVLAVVMVFVIIIVTIDLIRFLIVDFFVTDPPGAFSSAILKIFGLFLNVLIALELMENITAYLRKHAIQLELVIITALTAVARKIIIFDTKAEGGDIAGLAIAVLCLSIGYWIVHRIPPRKHE